jgi:predicted adenylyl cyclase CyaB
MSIRNIEIKCKHNAPSKIEEILLAQGAKYIGTDFQTDTYFNTPIGRLKLREGNIENNLIFYNRIESKSLKDSNISLYPVTDDPSKIKDILDQAYGISVIVRKERKIFFIGNIKFHIDWIDDLGSFIEIEAIDDDGSIDLNTLKDQCAKYIRLLELDPNDFIDQSYSDMIGI